MARGELDAGHSCCLLSACGRELRRAEAALRLVVGLDSLAGRLLPCQRLYCRAVPVADVSAERLGSRSAHRASDCFCVR